ncbi:MAG TPA: hypothetical protein VKP30_08000 [Polyangiaceae bacterium]|nr:hypothetical protein [Polyangiaceae bacterium]
MCRVRFKPVCTILVFVALLLCGGWGIAEPSASQPAKGWEKGNKLKPSGGVTIALSPGTQVHLAGNADLEVRPKVTLPPGVEGVAPQAFAAQLNSGRVDVMIDTKRRPADGVMLFGPRRTSILARGGRISVVAGANAVAVGVHDGKEASVGIGTTWKTVPSGRMIVVSASVVESRLPTPPARIALRRLALAVQGAAEPQRVTWDAVPGARRYVVRVLKVENKSLQQFDIAEPSLLLSNLSPGKYAVQVSSTDAYGIEGAPSTPTFVNVVGIALPNGAFLSNGKVYLEPNRPMAILNGNGIEMAYDDAATYGAVETHVGLRGTRATRLKFRVAGETEITPVELVPRALSVDIALSPASARWPRDKVSVMIQLPKNMAEFPKVELLPEVTINSQPVQVEWLRSEAGLEATIPKPPSYPGPWVLRAVVTDQYGCTLGRNFLEIASMVGADENEPPREIFRHQP